MSRQARALSKTGIYHVMLRGINQQQIFLEESDYKKFLSIVRECKEIKPFELNAYCLMGNHIHLLLKEKGEPVGQVIKLIASRFASWYNIKYQRIGHLFQDRFKSEVVETNEYFLTVLRYIHQNPVKACLCKSIDEYEYSSYKEYVDKEYIIDTEQVFNCIGKEALIEFHQKEIYFNCLDVEESIRIRKSEEQAFDIFKKLTQCTSNTEFQNLEITKKQKCIRKMYFSGLSIRQITRITGETKGMVEKWIKL